MKGFPMKEVVKIKSECFQPKAPTATKKKYNTKIVAKKKGK